MTFFLKRRNERSKASCVLREEDFLRSQEPYWPPVASVSSIKPISAYAKPPKIKYAKETTTVCPYCSVGCSIIVSTTSYGKVINTEGDPDSPINAGALCSKGSSLYQMSVANENRLTKPLYRAPYESEWKEVSWEWALDKIARNVKKSRDEQFPADQRPGACRSIAPRVSLRWEAPPSIMKSAFCIRNS